MFKTSWSVLLLGSALLVTGCSGPSDPTKPPVIASAGDYQETLVKAQSLSQESLKKYERGEPLDASEQPNLVEARRSLKGLIGYDPQRFAPYILSGRIALALGDYPGAKDDLTHGVFYYPREDLTPAGKDLFAETSNYLAQAHIFLKDTAGATKVIEDGLKIAPNSAILMIANASVLVQQKKYDEAGALLDKALILDPQNAKAANLRKLLDLEKHG